MIILRQKEFSGRVFMPGGKAVKIEDLNDKQLRNVAKYGETKGQRKNIRKNSIIVTTSLGASGGITGALLGRGGKAAGKGVLIGSAAGAGLSVLGYLHHKKNAKLAKEELKRREELRKEEEKTYSSKENREIVPPEIIEKVKAGEGVIHKYKGSWRIVSMKTNPPTFWNAHYESKEKAENALSAYHANK